VSKRPKQANAATSRPRRPTGRLRDLPIWSKLGLIMLVPTLATIIVGVSGLVDHIDEASNAERARTLAVLSQNAGDLVDYLQNERAYGVMIVTTRSGTPEHDKAVQAYTTEHAQVDSAKVPYAQQKTALDQVPPKVNTLLIRLDRNLGELPAVRSQIANGQRKVEEVERTYNTMVTDLLNVRDASAQLAADTTLSDHMRAAAAVARAKDYISQQRNVGLQVVAEGDFTVPLRRAFDLTQSGYVIADSTLRQVGTQQEIQVFDRTVAGEGKQQATNLTIPLSNLQGRNTTAIPFNRDQWESAMIGYNKLFRQVEKSVDADIVGEATNLRDDVQRRVFVETSVLLGMLLLAILFAWLVARSMARSLRELRQGALSVAQFGLPHAVNRLRDPTLSSSLTPAQVADQVAEPLPVRSRDEFGQVTEAFNAVHLEAVRTAAEQAALRSSVATMFVNLARRSQILVDRLIGHLDRLERGEEDPDRLAELFQLDHLATRMRRNDENLLVLAGADSTRVQREPAALIDVLRAAQSEVEHYTRIEFGVIDRDIEVGSHAVNDMVHLVAELFDNATAFSPPNSTVLVEARRLGDGAVLSVEDRGIGMSREQLHDLNERLADPPMVDVAVSRMMGLVVVARLANRHDVKVELRSADGERGTLAEVALPVGVLVSSSAVGRLQVNNTGFGGDPAQTQARAQLAGPLALESGHGGYSGGRPFDPNPPMPSGGMLGTGGRSVPAWYDLTGAPNGTNGTNGVNGFHSPHEAAPQGFAGGESLPRRNGGENYRPDGEPGGFGPAIPRQLPANPESQGRGPFVPPVPPVSGPPNPAYGRPMAAPPGSGPVPPPPAHPRTPGHPVSGHSAPPAWPPISTDRDGHGTPPVPESLAAALDMTAELPRYRPDRATTGHPRGVERPASSQPPQTEAERSAAAAAAAHEAAVEQAAEAQATAAAQIAAAHAGRQRAVDGQYADETMELPIFRELESAWFTTAKPAPLAPPPGEVGEGTIGTQRKRIPTGEPARSAGVPHQGGPAESRSGSPATVGAASSAGGGATNPWHTMADEGWQAARRAADIPVDSTTTAGLPKRRPMAQLVPGGVDRAENSTQRRTPEAVRGLLSAYHRGVQRGRSKEQSTNPEDTPGGQQSSQAGKEHEA